MPATLPASTTAGGLCFALPDTCLTPAPPAPPVPVPYPNMASLTGAKKTAENVMFVKKPVVTLKSEIPRSMGDEPGVNKGVMSGMNMGKIIFKTGAAKVKVEGHDCVRLTSLCGHNGANANIPSGAVIVPSQFKVLVP